MGTSEDHVSCIKYIIESVGNSNVDSLGTGPTICIDGRERGVHLLHNLFIRGISLRDGVLIVASSIIKRNQSTEVHIIHIKGRPDQFWVIHLRNVEHHHILRMIEVKIDAVRVFKHFKAGLL